MTRTAALALVVCALATSCKERTRAPLPDPVSPSAAQRSSDTRRSEVELTDAPRETPQAAPAEATPPAAAASTTDVRDVSELGPLEVISPEDARRQANERITAQNADAELARLRAEITPGS